MKIRIYYEDTDCGNVVYYANYLKYMERSRTEFLRERGVTLAELHKQGYGFVVVEAHVKYRASAHYNDLIDIESRITEFTSVTVTFESTITNENGQLLATGEIRLACVKADGKVCKVPDEIKKMRTVNKTS